MERLTKRAPVEFGYAEYVWNGDVDEQDAIDRLAAYEDTGLTPEQCAEYAKAERDGRLVVLPCKEGTPLYHIDFVPCETCTKRGDMPLSDYRDLYGDPYVLDCEEECPKMVREYPAKFQLAMMDLVGKDLFLTREEAEAALKERNE